MSAKTDWFKKFLFIFKIVYLLYLLLAFNSFVNAEAWMNAASYGVTAMGAGMAAWMLFRYKRYMKAYNLWLLLAFIASYIISAGAHISYGVMENIKGTIWLVLPIMLVYITAFDMSAEEMRKELKWLSWIYVLYSTAANLVSLSMVYWGRMYEFKDEAGAYHVIGYRWNRLWGIYDDPNHGATITIIALFILIWAFLAVKRIWLRILMIPVFLINYCYVALSDSRTGLVGLTVGILIGGFYGLWQYRRRCRHLFLGAAGILLATGVAFTGIFAVKAAYRPIEKKIVSSQTKAAPSTKPPVNTNNQLRKKDINKDYSNGRIEIWESGIQIIKSSPIIGVGYRNMAPYTLEHLPDTYLVDNGQGGLYNSMHNLELDIFVSQGIIGILLFLALLLNMGRILWRRCRHTEGEADRMEVLSFTAAISLGVAGTFLSFIFYVNAPQSFCFWLFLGYLMRNCQLVQDRERK